MKENKVLYICLSIIIGFVSMGIIIAFPLNRIAENGKVKYEIISPNDKARYDMISPNDNNIIIFDTSTGTYWRKFIESNSGPNDWEKEDLPDFDE